MDDVHVVGLGPSPVDVDPSPLFGHLLRYYVGQPDEPLLGLLQLGVEIILLELHLRQTHTERYLLEKTVPTGVGFVHVRLRRLRKQVLPDVFVQHRVDRLEVQRRVKQEHRANLEKLLQQLPVSVHVLRHQR